jgi:hypothetical protein
LKIKQIFLLLPLLITTLLVSCGRENSTSPESAKEAAPTISPEDIQTLKVEEDDGEFMITGKKIVIDEFDLQGLHKKLHQRKDIKKVTLKCEELILSRQLTLPGADLEIKTKKMRTIRNAQIVLTPPSYSDEAKPLQDGLDGIAGSTLILKVKEAEFHQSDKPLFVVTGGNGQKAGAGFNGEDGKNVKHSKGVIATYSFVRGEPILTSGTNTHPTHGKEPAMPGKPGEPGAGGRIETTLVLHEDQYNLSGGLAGRPARDVLSGRPGQPNPYHIIEDGKKETHSLPPQQLYLAPVAMNQIGAPGELIYLREEE